MGVTTDVWRARIGAFLPIIRSLSNRERRSWPSRKIFRIYKRPPEPCRTHHLSLHILSALIFLTIGFIISLKNPFVEVRKLEIHQVFLDVFVVHFAVFHYHKEKQHYPGWQDRSNAIIRMIMFVLLLLCGDIESNPGPNEPQPLPMDVRRKKVHKIERMDTHEKIGVTASTLSVLWSEVCRRWNDLNIDNYKLTEEDGTEFSDDSYYQQLETKTPLQLRLKIKGTNSTSKSYARVNERPLTDEAVHEIATNRLSHKIVDLGIAMEFTRDRISKYQAENATEPRVESRGTENMILDWRQSLDDVDQVGSFCRILKQAQLHELADDLSKGMISSTHRVKQNIDLTDLQQELKKYYVDVLCYVRTIPWKPESGVPINDGFRPPSLFLRKKTSKRNVPRFDLYSNCAKSTFFDEINFNETSKTENEEFLRESYNDILRIQQNNVPPSRILITGHPGIGKTTLLYKLAHDWAISAEDSELKSVKLLIHLSLEGVSKKVMLGDEVIRQLLPKDTNLTGKQIEDCLRRNSDNVVILLDGFDGSDFAFPVSDKDQASCGSLYRAVKFEEFRSCRMIVTCRPSKVEEFRGKLFNPYAEIIIKGFVLHSIDDFIDNYCNEKDAQHVKEKIASNLFSLKALLRTPLFLAMICETIPSDMTDFITSLPLTRTNLLKKLCTYLYKTCQDKFTNSRTLIPKALHDIGLEECLATLGKLAGKQYIIDLSHQDITSRERVILDFSIKAGFISSKDRSSISDDRNFLYFFHGILRDFCLAQMLVLRRLSLQNSSQSQDLIDVNDVQLSQNVFIFECGLLAGNTCTQYLFDHSSWSEYKCSTDFLIQCYFECQSAGYMKINTAIFDKKRTLVVDLNTFNHFPAARDFLLHNPQSTNSFYLTEFMLKGEEAELITHENNLDKLKRDSLLTAIRMDMINELMTSCPFLMSLILLNCSLSLAGFTVPTSGKFKDIRKVSIIDCRGKNLVHTLLRYIAKQFPALQSLVLTSVCDVDVESRECLNLCNTISMLSDIGPTCSEMDLGGMDGADLNHLCLGRNSYLHELTVSDNVDTINTDKVLSSIASHFPSLFALTLSRCNLQFDGMDAVHENEGHFGSTSTSNICLTVIECKSQVIFGKLLMMMSMYFPYLNLLRIVDSSIDVTNITEKTSLQNLKCIYFKHCLQHVDLSDFILAFKCTLPCLPQLKFIDCSLMFSREVMNGHDDHFPDIALSNCIIPSERLSWVKTWCQFLTFHINDNLYVEILHEDVLIAHLHSKLQININDVMKFPGWFPELQALYIYSTLQTLPLDAFRGVQFPYVQTVLMRECKEKVNMSDTVSILSACCPRLQEMIVRHCNVSFSSNAQCVISSISQLEIEACTPLNFSTVMSFISLHCPRMKELIIENCKVVSDGNDSLRTQMIRPEYKMSYSIQSAANVSPVTRSDMSEVPTYTVGEFDTNNARTDVKIKKILPKLQSLHKVHVKNCPNDLDLTGLITSFISHVKSLAGGFLFYDCSLGFSSEVAVADSPFLQAIAFQNCTLPSKSLYWLVKLCDVVYLYSNDGVKIEIFEPKSEMSKVIHVHSDEPINMGDYPNLPIWIPNLDALCFYSLLVDRSDNPWNGLQFSSANNVGFVDCNRVVDIKKAFLAASLYCKKIERFTISNGRVSFGHNDSCCLPLKILVFDKVMKTKFTEIITFITKFCPNAVELTLRDNCTFEENDRFEEHDVPVVHDKLESIKFRYFKKSPLDVANVASTISLGLKNVVHLSFDSCALAYTSDCTSLSVKWFDLITFKDCSFPPNSFLWTKSCCKIANIHVNDLDISISDMLTDLNKLKVTLKSDYPINIHDAPGLPFDTYDDHILELDFHNVMDLRQHNPVGTIHYLSATVVRFFRCIHTLNVVNTLLVLSQCCPNLTQLTVSNTEVSLAGGRDLSHWNIKKISIDKCNHVDFTDILLFLTSCCPSVEYFSVDDSKISFNSSLPQTSKIAKSSVREIYLCNCHVPDDFLQRLNDEHLLDFEVSHFRNKHEDDVVTEEWSITRKEINPHSSP